VAFAVYLIGESKNLAGKDILLNLTYDKKTRIRSAAVNALGKMKFSESDADFSDKVSARLIELASENNPKKTFNKDIAFAFRNFKNERDIPALMNLMSHNYYGVRFTASEDLADYGDIYYNYLTDDEISSLSSNKLWFQSFLNSLINLSENKFRSIIDRILNLSISQDEVINYNLTELLHKKRESSKEGNFLTWINGIIANLEGKAVLKVR
jgi:HEAT repeat protein